VADTAAVRLVAVVDGYVQGVGFRFTTRERARALGLTGSAVNEPDGRVRVTAEGPRPSCEQLLSWLRGPSAPGRVRSVTAVWEPATGGAWGFSVG